MNLLLLGSGAAEGWPAPFCECVACESVRKTADARDVRSRSGALIGDDLKIDFSPDTVLQMQRCRRSLRSVRTILFTHEHSDHLAVDELQWMVAPFTRTPMQVAPVQVFGNDRVLAQLRAQAAPDVLRAVELQLLEPFGSVTTRDGDSVLPLPAEHCPGALVLRITRSAKSGASTVFYGHDSGRYPSATLDALTGDGVQLNIALFDCTYGGGAEHGGHMGIRGVIEMADELRRRRAIDDRTRAVATHFSHNGELLHEQLIAKLSPHGIDTAFDGMTIEVSA